MTHQETLQYLRRVQRLGIKLGLENFTGLLDGLGRPQEAFPSVIVAGSNGKGSVCAFLASILKSAGHRVGLYTSPHLVRYEERIAVGGVPVTTDEFDRALSRTRRAIDDLLGSGRLGTHPTHFEVLTAAAWDHFRRCGIDVAVQEIGMGGRLDAVAAAEAPVVVITNVSLEHTRFLGGTLAEIASEKAAVIGRGTRVVSGVSGAEAARVIRSRAAAVQATLVERGRHAEIRRPDAARPEGFEVATQSASYRELMIPLVGWHQVDNAVLAVLASEALEASGCLDHAILPAAVRSGLAATRWPGRFQIVRRKPLFIIDGAHNPAACAALARTLRDLREKGACAGVHLVCGILQDKDLPAMAEALFGVASRLTATRGRSDRFRNPREIAAAAREHQLPAAVHPDPRTAIDEALAGCGPGEAVVVCGSLYLVGDVLKLIGQEPFPRS